jgi:RND superfamily putative drug exporter
VFEWLARLVLRRPRHILVASALLLAIAAVISAPIGKSLTAGGFQDPSSESAHAARVLTDNFRQGDTQLVLSVSTPEGPNSAPARRAALDAIQKLQDSGYVTGIVSAWTLPPQSAPGLISKDGQSGLIVADLSGDENETQLHAKELMNRLTGARDGATVSAGGAAATNVEMNDQLTRDLLIMESVAFPLSFIALVWIFGGLIAALLPMVVGAVSIIGGLAILRCIALFTNVSIFALNLTAAMSLALAVDYTLLIINRYREERANGLTLDEALVKTVSTAGRTVLFSAVTVGLSLIALLLFPMYFLRSFAYAGIAVVAFSSVAALVLAPAVIALMGDRMDAFDIRRAVRRILRRPEPRTRPVTENFWYRSTKFVMSRPIAIGSSVVVLLLFLGLPFTSLKFGFLDDRVLPTSASSRQLGDQMRLEYRQDAAATITVVLEDPNGISPAGLTKYASRLSQVKNVVSVSAPSALFVDGKRAGQNIDPAGSTDHAAFLSIASDAALFSHQAETQLDALHRVPAPNGTSVLFGGIAQSNRDSVRSIVDKLPAVLAFIAIVVYLLLFLLTGSIILPLKAIMLNMLALTATFGALVWIFQEGHIGGLGTTATGTLVATIPVLLFCVSFGLSMDYEVFLLSRIREAWLPSGRTHAESDEAVALGLARAGRVVTAAAFLMIISFMAMIPAQVSFMRMFGVGLALAIFVDATLVRMVLVPAFMQILGGFNWWAPKPLARWQNRWFGTVHGPIEPSDEVRRVRTPAPEG